ncbi:MAG TPA: hypothetical protein VFR23_03435 [Jiangellaceae bacterium]|nr:hypothetical protein [Jiangellaceae bacterium]
MALPFGSGKSPVPAAPGLVGEQWEAAAPHSETLTTAGGAQTLTFAELKSGLLVINTDDAQTLTLPTAALINAGLIRPAVGTRLEFDVINVGDTTLTIAVGTGGDATVGNSKDSVLTIVANASKHFIIRVTGVLENGDASDSYVLYGMGSVGAATA